MKYIQHVSSPLGTLTLASDGETLTGLWMEGQKYYGAGLNPGAEEKALPVFSAAKDWLSAYFSGNKPNFTPPLSYEGSVFRRAVLGILLSIPYGQTITYGEIARRLKAGAGAKIVSAQAVGGAVGHNPISIIIPCHRVVGSGGSLTGYAGGVSKKIQLLKLEKAPVKTFSAPKKGTAL